MRMTVCLEWQQPASKLVGCCGSYKMSMFMSTSGLFLAMFLNAGFAICGYKLRGFVRDELTMIKLFVGTLFSVAFTLTCFLIDSNVGMLGMPVSHFLAGIVAGAFSDPKY